MPLFGYSASELLAGATPALGTSTLQITFSNPQPDAPLPDLMQLISFPQPGQFPIAIKFNAQAEGSLHAAYGVAEGTPGEVVVKMAEYIAPPRGPLLRADRIRLYVQ